MLDLMNPVYWGGVADTDVTPFTFNPIIDADRETVYNSNVVSISGITTLVDVSSVNGQIRINGGSWVNSGQVKTGDTLQARTQSSPDNKTQKSVIITVGEYTTTFNVTTSDLVPDNFSFTSLIGRRPDDPTFVEYVTVTGLEPNTTITVNSNSNINDNSVSYRKDPSVGNYSILAFDQDVEVPTNSSGELFLAFTFSGGILSGWYSYSITVGTRTTSWYVDMLDNISSASAGNIFAEVNQSDSRSTIFNTINNVFNKFRIVHPKANDDLLVELKTSDTLEQFTTIKDTSARNPSQTFSKQNYIDRTVSGIPDYYDIGTMININDDTITRNGFCGIIPLNMSFKGIEEVKKEDYVRFEITKRVGTGTSPNQQYIPAIIEAPNGADSTVPFVVNAPGEYIWKVSIPNCIRSRGTSLKDVTGVPSNRGNVFVSNSPTGPWNNSQIFKTGNAAGATVDYYVKYIITQEIYDANKISGEIDVLSFEWFVKPQTDSGVNLSNFLNPITGINDEYIEFMRFGGGTNFGWDYSNGTGYDYGPNNLTLNCLRIECE